LDDEPRLSACVQAVQGYEANSPERFVFSSLLALKQHRWDDAQNLITEGYKAGLPGELLRRSKETLDARKAAFWKDGARDESPWWLWGGLTALMVVVLIALGQRRLKPTAA
jgi:hypothetical protein